MFRSATFLGRSFMFTASISLLGLSCGPEDELDPEGETGVSKAMVVSAADGLGCVPVSPTGTPPPGVPVSFYGRFRLRLPNPIDGSVFCATDDGVSRGGRTIGRVTTNTCVPKARFWDVFAGGPYIAVCKADSLRYCDLDGIGPAYIASCMGTDETITGDAEVYENFVLTYQSSTGWKNVLNLKPTVATGLKGQYLQDRYNGLRYLTRKPSSDATRAVEDSVKLPVGQSARQLWDLY